MTPTWVDRLLGSNIDYIGYAVPFFLLLIGIELVVGLVRSVRLYRLHDSINDLSCGIIEQVLGLFLKVLLLAGYIYLFDNWRLFDPQSWSPAGKVFAAVALFFGVDFCFYWFHRVAHEWAAPWATHVVHHQSEDYNLAVALRQSALEDGFAWVFYLPLALLGFPPLWYVAVHSINLLYQFWVHTRAIDKLGPLEWFMNTPSHHRVHHARNPQYLDRNYAGMLIIWDRMFGTFEPEVEEPVYGLTKPLRSWNPLWANVHMWAELAHDAWRAPHWFDKIRIWFMPLGWTPRGMEPRPRAQPVTAQTFVKYHTRLPRGLNLYVVTQFVAALVLGTQLTVLAEDRPLSELAAPAVLVLGSLALFGGIFERRRWALALEVVRLAALVPVLSLLDKHDQWQAVLFWGVGGWSVASLAWLVYYRREFTGRATVVVPAATPADIAIPTPTSTIDGSESYARRVGVS